MAEFMRGCRQDRIDTALGLMEVVTLAVQAAGGTVVSERLALGVAVALAEAGERVKPPTAPAA